jgi:7-cyano-7-deazaguanine synthase
MSSVLCIMSGGLDSTVAMLWAKKNFDSVGAVIFDYGQKNDVEIDCAEKICKKLEVGYKVFTISNLEDIIDSELLVFDGEVNIVDEKGARAFVPNRNQLFITLAHAMAQCAGYENLIIGFSGEGRYDLYPDSSKAYLQSITATTNAGSAKQINILAPLMELDKADTFKMADDFGELEMVIEDTHTCYNGFRGRRYVWGSGCDECPACQLRKEGYEKYLLKYGK